MAIKVPDQPLLAVLTIKVWGKTPEDDKAADVVLSDLSDALGMAGEAVGKYVTAKFPNLTVTEEI